MSSSPLSSGEPLDSADKRVTFDVLKEHCGASEDLWKQFDSVWPCAEFRFQGKLGFGGKIRFNKGFSYVDYYREDETNERESMCAAANYSLKILEKSRPLINPIL